jgi:hypothetical protein
MPNKSQERYNIDSIKESQDNDCLSLSISCPIGSNKIGVISNNNLADAKQYLVGLH